MKTEPLFDKAGYRYWWADNGKLHREDGPAIEHITGYQEWWFNGERHRVDGPAIIDPITQKQDWWYQGKWARDVRTQEEFEQLLRLKAFW
jgi:hypothetical protein